MRDDFEMSVPAIDTLVQLASDETLGLPESSYTTSVFTVPM